MSAAEPISPAPAQDTSVDTHTLGGGAGEPSTGTDQSEHGAQPLPVGSGPTCPANHDAEPVAIPPGGPAETEGHATPIPPTSRRDQDLLLYLFADQLSDVEGLRIATENRLRTLLSQDQWGKAVNPDLPEVHAVEAQLDQIRTLEHGITLNLKRAMRAHYLGPWCKATTGVGEKQLARLLAVIGDPSTREKPSQLWAYCGLHVWHGPPRGSSHPTDHPHGDAQDPGVGGVAPHLTRGRQANWNTEAKTRAFLIAESCIKQRTSPYRKVYDDGRAKYATAVHSHPCKRCGPSGSPAAAGSDLSDGHKHARAMRLVMKQILLDLWKQTRGVA